MPTTRIIMATTMLLALLSCDKLASQKERPEVSVEVQRPEYVGVPERAPFSYLSHEAELRSYTCREVDFTRVAERTTHDYNKGKDVTAPLKVPYISLRLECTKNK